MFPLLYFYYCFYRKPCTAANLQVFFYSNMWILCKWLLWNTSLCLLLWYSLLLYIFWSFWWKESHLDEVLPHDLKVLVPWPFPGSNHQADLLDTAAVDEMCHLPSHWDFAIYCLILIPSDLTRQDVSWISSWTTYCLGFYSAPFVHNLNVHPPALQGPQHSIQCPFVSLGGSCLLISPIIGISQSLCFYANLSKLWVSHFKCLLFNSHITYPCIFANSHPSGKSGQDLFSVLVTDSPVWVTKSSSKHAFLHCPCDQALLQEFTLCHLFSHVICNSVLKEIIK